MVSYMRGIDRHY